MSSEEPNAAGRGSAFQAHLALGLHAFAQPLAILRAKLYPDAISRMDSEELAELANDSADQVQRLCTLFNYVQEIVIAENATSLTSTLPVNDFLAHVVDGVDLWFQDTGIKLELASPLPDAAVFGNEAQLSQAISSLLLLAHGNSKAGDTVTIACEIKSALATFAIRNADAEIDVLNAEGRLALALVETLLRKQDGTFSYALQPLSFEACVPSAAITT